METSQNELIDIHKGRSAIYEYLSTIYKKPVNDTFIGLSEKYATYICEYAIQLNSDKLKEAGNLLSEYAKVEKTTDNTILLNELNLNHTTLFSLGYNSVANTESSFLNPSGLVRQEEWEQVKAIYNANGFGKLSDLNEPEDHIAVELAFMQVLCNRLADSTENTDQYNKIIETQIHFIDEHLEKWIHSFASSVIAKSNSFKFKYPLYKAISLLASGFIECDRQTLAELKI